MSLEARELYSSPNGDRWYLVRDPGAEQVFIMHEPMLHRGAKQVVSKSESFSVEEAMAPSIGSFCA
jgi:hypothetical protein